MSYQVDASRQNQHLLAGTATHASAEIGLKDVGISVTVINDTYVEYNFFVRQYNDACNRIGNKYLKSVPTSRYFRSLRCKYMEVFLSPRDHPFISFAIFLLSVYRLVSLIRISLIVKNNRRLVTNPFERMISVGNLAS